MKFCLSSDVWQIFLCTWFLDMNIGGLQKNSLIDFPERICAVVFTKGCNFLCPYCHNPNLLGHMPYSSIEDAGGTSQAKEASAHISEGEVLNFLSRRVGLLDGVVISGGEPCLQANLNNFCRKLKNMGYEVKLDTNGSHPQVLEKLINSNLLDYVAVDLKADPDNYPPEISPKLSPAELKNALSKSAEILKQSGLAYEFRTTCAEPFINNNSIRAIAQFVTQLAPPKGVPLYLQKPNYNMVLNPQFHAGMVAPDDAAMQAWRKIALEHTTICELR